jgi:hypothetical protein
MDDKRWAMMSLTEKIRWRNKHPIKNSWLFADKILAKDIVLQRAPECKVNKIIYIPKKPEDIDIDTLPKDYIFKANHGSGWVIKVKDDKNAKTGDDMTNEILIMQAKKWLSLMYGHGNEKQYSLIEPKVFFEEYLEDFLECRFFCFDGKVKFVMIDVHESDGDKSTIYDIGWNRIRVHWRDPEGDDIPKPKNFDKVVHIIEKLASDLDFIRIDVLIKGRDIYFGEFTFTPNAGSSAIHPPEYDMIWGGYWTHDMADKKELKIPNGAGDLGFGSKIHSKTRLHGKILSYKIKKKLRKF